MATALLGVSQVLKVDPEGRVQLTDGLKSYAGITDQVAFVGLGEKFQLWAPQAFEAHLASARERLRDLRAGLELSGRAGRSPEGEAR